MSITIWIFEASQDNNWDPNLSYIIIILKMARVNAPNRHKENARNLQVLQAETSW